MKKAQRRSVHGVLACWLAGFGLLGLMGCGSSPPPAPTPPPAHDHDHDHADDHAHADDHDHASEADFASTVATLRGHYETIRDAMPEKDLDKAHDPLHAVGHLLEALPELAGKAGLTDEDLATARAAATAMFEGYGQLDHAIHEGEEADYEAVRDQLDKGMADLEAVVQRAKKAE